jgi:hypothetical protein
MNREMIYEATPVTEIPQGNDIGQHADIGGWFTEFTRSIYRTAHRNTAIVLAGAAALSGVAKTGLANADMAPAHKTSATVTTAKRFTPAQILNTVWLDFENLSDEHIVDNLQSAEMGNYNLILNGKCTSYNENNPFGYSYKKITENRNEIIQTECKRILSGPHKGRLIKIKTPRNRMSTTNELDFNLSLQLLELGNRAAQSAGIPSGDYGAADHVSSTKKKATITYAAKAGQVKELVLRAGKSPQEIWNK